MPRQAELFEKPSRPRRVMMHVVDAGQGCAQFKCSRCGHVSGWLTVDEDESVSSLKRGRPCPKCNPIK